jgi:hypothetical protein
VAGGREHVAVIRPHVALSNLVRRRQMHRIGGSYEQAGWSRNDQSTGSS